VIRVKEIHGLIDRGSTDLVRIGPLVIGPILTDLVSIGPASTDLDPTDLDLIARDPIGPDLTGPDSAGPSSIDPSLIDRDSTNPGLIARWLMAMAPVRRQTKRLVIVRTDRTSSDRVQADRVVMVRADFGAPLEANLLLAEVQVREETTTTEIDRALSDAIPLFPAATVRGDHVSRIGLGNRMVIGRDGQKVDDLRFLEVRADFLLTAQAEIGLGSPGQDLKAAVAKRIGGRAFPEKILMVRLGAEAVTIAAARAPEISATVSHFKIGLDLADRAARRILVIAPSDHLVGRRAVVIEEARVAASAVVLRDETLVDVRQSVVLN
jgi:hypothetical protein